MTEDQANNIVPDMHDMDINTANASSTVAREIRNEIMEYCVNEGDLVWQYNKI